MVSVSDWLSRIVNKALNLCQLGTNKYFLFGPHISSVVFLLKMYWNYTTWLVRCRAVKGLKIAPEDLGKIMH